MKRVPIFVFTIITFMALLLSACGPVMTPTAEVVVPTKPPVPTPTSIPTATVPANPNLILATTTSTQAFEANSGFTVQVVAVGSGAAIKLGEQGNADVLLVHSPAAEKKFMDGGFGTDRRLVMHNYYIIVGPESDPAGIASATSAVEAFQKIAASGAQFISRGDQSGTNTMELGLWKLAGITPADQAWYVETGSGMGATLTVASEKEAYTLTDRATFLTNQANLQLAMLYQNDAALLNAYHVIVVNHDKWPSTNLDGAVAFADYITSSAGQDIIAAYGVDKYGQALFIPDAGKTDAELGLP
jgi:tungstate transport system substrate-binding protein